MNTFRFIRNVNLGIKNLMLHKLRSVLTMLGVVFGVGSVVAMLAVGEGASRQALAQIRKLGSTNIIVETIKPVSDDNQNTGGHSHMSMYGLKYIDNTRIVDTIPHVRRTVPARIIRKQVRLGSHSLDLRVVGTTPAWFQLVKRPLIAGRVLNPADIKNHAAVCVLTERGARKLLATRNTIGQSIRIGGDYFQIVGIVKAAEGGGAIQTPDHNTDVYMPLDSCRDHFGDIITQISSGSFQRQLIQLHYIIVQVDNTADVPSVAQAVTALLQHFHDKLDYQVQIPLQLLHEVEAEQRRKVMTLAWIAAVSLLVGGIGIMNIMLASVTERTREIGIRRAIGARKSQIVTQFLIETVVLSTAGGIFGLAAGIGLPFAAYLAIGMPMYVTTWSVMLSLGISVGVGILFGIYPAMRAAELDPIIALRHE